MELMKNGDPLSAIIQLYDDAKDKRTFVFAMAATLLLRHRQWQAASQGLI